MSSQELKEKGFTIIEVVLVLAIAALIFLMVFIALPALQRNQRDTQRRNDASRFISQLSQFATNNNGTMPANTDITGGKLFAKNYLKWDGTAASTGEFNDPTKGTGYDIKVGIAAPSNVGEVQYARGAKCNGEQIVSVGASNKRVAAVAIKLEGSGTFCKDTQS